jgi:lipopolysaccharide/colanic/teichoic acid biosynthesis glycosyltransferase
LVKLRDSDDLACRIEKLIEDTSLRDTMGKNGRIKVLKEFDVGIVVSKYMEVYEKIFGIYKFRTMTNERDENGELLSDEKRLLGVGKFIRSTSLDELLQIFNVLKGEMSFVGPRPLLIEYLPLYNQEQKRRHDVKPGITGWAQVNGRNAISWEQKFEYDVWYVQNQSFLLDMKILWMTFLKVVNRSDISSDTTVTMEKFKGSN